MIKKFTGITFTPQEFRKREQCLMCGKVNDTVRDDLCDSCSHTNIPKCKMCDILMRNGTYKFYTYDIKEDHRDMGEEFKVSKELVREFEYETEFHNPINTEMLCPDCIGWRERIRNVCKGCGKSFENTQENYQKNGNFCETCSADNELNQNDKETDDYRPKGESICHSTHED